MLRYVIDPGCPIDAPIKPPVYSGDVGYDLGVAIRDESITIEPHGFIDVPTFVRVELPDGVWGDIRPRSSTYAKRRLVVMGGTIDQGYRGLLSVFVYNPNPVPVQVVKGDYLAQLVLCPIITPALFKVEKLSPSARAEKGFGSSGGFANGATVTPINSQGAK